MPEEELGGGFIQMLFSPPSPQGDGEPKAGLEGPGRRGEKGRKTEEDRAGDDSRQLSRGSKEASWWRRRGEASPGGGGVGRRG